MQYSLELYFDEKTECRLTATLAELKKFDAGLYAFDLNARPHITLGNWLNINTQEAGCCLKNLFEKVDHFPVSLQSVGLFPSTGCVFLAPTVTNDLLQLHKTVHDRMSVYDHSGYDHYLPDRWVPHCALEITEDRSRLMNSLLYLAADFSPFCGIVETALLYECTRPVKRLLQVYHLHSVFTEKE